MWLSPRWKSGGYGSGGYRDRNDRRGREDRDRVTGRGTAGHEPAAYRHTGAVAVTITRRFRLARVLIATFAPASAIVWRPDTNRLM
jgi:hypothetical protein